MLNANELKAQFKRKGLTQEEVAKRMNISSRTLSNKLKKGILKSDEIENLIELLDIENPMPIFFAS